MRVLPPAEPFISRSASGFDGRGLTDAGHGQYPRPLDLQSAEVRARTDGELFYFIQNGIRNTPMPGWQLPDQNIWELVAYIRRLPVVSAPVRPDAPVTAAIAATYVGSTACRDCHRDIYDRWSKTRMANVVRDPKEHPDAVTPDLSQPDPLVTFTKDDIAFVYAASGNNGTSNGSAMITTRCQPSGT
jgi:hypothetical protein